MFTTTNLKGFMKWYGLNHFSAPLIGERKQQIAGVFISMSVGERSYISLDCFLLCHVGAGSVGNRGIH